jgi:hypothetical protein
VVEWCKEMRQETKGRTDRREKNHNRYEEMTREDRKATN